VGTPGGLTDFFTCPAGITTLVKTISIGCWEGVLNDVAELWVYRAGLATSVPFAVCFNNGVISPAGQVLCFLVLQPGDKLQMDQEGSGTSVCSADCSGAFLEGVAGVV